MRGSVLLPRLVEPLQFDGDASQDLLVDWYADDADPTPEQLDRAVMFVPRYLGHSNASFAAEMPRLRVMQLLTIGYDYAVAHVPAGVELCNAQGVHEGSTAELALGLAIASLRGIDRAVLNQADGRWDHRRGQSLQGRHVLVLGAGPVGQLIAERFRPLSGRVTVVARRERPGVRSAADLPALLPTAHVVVLAVALTPETTGMVDAAFLARMRDGALLVNVARGPVVQTPALLAELESGRLRAALDVTDPEPVPAGHPLWEAPGTIITAHIGGDTDAFPVLARALIARQAEALAAGRPLENVIRDGR